MSFVSSPTKVSQHKRLQKLFCTGRTSIFLHKLSNGNLSFLTKVFILRNSFSLYLILCKSMGKPKINEIIQMGTRLKREVLSLFWPKSLICFIYNTCLTNTCYIKTNPSLFLLTELTKENCYTHVLFKRSKLCSEALVCILPYLLI